jgi:hypothetical protein
MKRTIFICFISLLLFKLQLAFADADQKVWRTTIHPSIGIAEFKFEGEEIGISVRTLQNNRHIQDISTYFTLEGWLEFYDLNGDGYQDVVIHPPDWNFGSPISHGKVWIFNPDSKAFAEAEEISGRGFIEKAEERGCLILTYRKSPTKRPNYIGEYWCFDTPTGEWKHKKDYKDRFPKQP